MIEGMFIVFEGIDGAGTTTQTAMLAQWFAGQERPVHLTWEPSTGRVGRLIREYLSGSFDVPDVDRHYHSLALLFAADRLDHLAREVTPRLKNGINVISDRYVLSSYVYQSLHCDPEWVVKINQEATPAHLTILLDLPVEMAMERLARRSLFTASEIYETEDQQQKIRDLYLKAVRELYSEHQIVVIDGSPEPEGVHRQVVAQLEPRLEAFNNSS
jgi:dTMP kinase